ncbi:death domain-associated protein 6-like [Ciona intestinalis]
MSKVNEVIVISSEEEDIFEVKKSPEKISEKSGLSSANSNGHSEIKSPEMKMATELKIKEKNEKCAKLNVCSKQQTKSEKLLEEFIALCMPLMKTQNRPDDVIQFLRRRYVNASSTYKTSESFCCNLQSCIKELQKGGVSREFVYINDIATELQKHATKLVKRKLNGTSEKGEKTEKRLKILENSSTEKPTVQIQSNGPGTSSGQEGLDSTHDEQSSSSVTAMDEIEEKIRRYEDMMKRLSEEIKRYQAHELSLDEMDDDDSAYVEEGQLKDRMMKVFNKICALKKVNNSTGRHIERKICVTCTRFPEINKKVEQYVNKSQKFPDFFSVLFLVKRANLKHSLMLSEASIQQIARSAFTEVGEAIQKRRKTDDLLNRGCYLTEKIEEMQDPAETDKSLEEKLNENGKEARTKLTTVIENFCKRQTEIESVIPKSTQDSSDHENDPDCGSDPPSEDNDDSEESDCDADNGTDDITIKKSETDNDVIDMTNSD